MFAHNIYYTKPAIHMEQGNSGPIANNIVPVPPTCELWFQYKVSHFQVFQPFYSNANVKCI